MAGIEDIQGINRENRTVPFSEDDRKNWEPGIHEREARLFNLNLQKSKREEERFQ